MPVVAKSTRPQHSRIYRICIMRSFDRSVPIVTDKPHIHGHLEDTGDSDSLAGVITAPIGLIQIRSPSTVPEEKKHFEERSQKRRL